MFAIGKAGLLHALDRDVDNCIQASAIAGVRDDAFELLLGKFTEFRRPMWMDSHRRDLAVKYPRKGRFHCCFVKLGPYESNVILGYYTDVVSFR